MKQNGAVYYYITNLQGDVVRLVNSAGNTAAWYKYDPYGNATTASGSHATINPLRYRGYYYDTETGLYYCQSRYYDPVIGRFINADKFVSTGQGLIGYNMFAYCGNNPLCSRDASGSRSQVCIDDEQNLMRMPWSDGNIGGKSAYSLIRSPRNPNPWITPMIVDYITNTDEQTVLNARYLAFYRGAIVIKLEAIDNAAFSFGIIFLGDNVDAQTVRHEFGHCIHLLLIGRVNYMLKVFIPSLSDFWSGMGYEVYYSEPQEYIADMLGHVNRTYYDNPYPYSISNWWALTYFYYSLLP